MGSSKVRLRRAWSVFDVRSSNGYGCTLCADGKDRPDWFDVQADSCLRLGTSHLNVFVGILLRCQTIKI